VAKRNANPARRPTLTRRTRTTKAGPKGSVRKTSPKGRTGGSKK
jgi:hypothetical protein